MMMMMVMMMMMMMMIDEDHVEDVDDDEDVVDGEEEGGSGGGGGGGRGRDGDRKTKNPNGKVGKIPNFAAIQKRAFNGQFRVCCALSCFYLALAELCQASNAYMRILKRANMAALAVV